MCLGLVVVVVVAAAAAAVGRGGGGGVGVINLNYWRVSCLPLGLKLGQGGREGFLSNNLSPSFNLCMASDRLQRNI